MRAVTITRQAGNGEERALREMTVVSKFSIIAIAGLIAVGVTGCGDDESTTPTTQTQTSATTQTAEQETTRTGTDADSRETRESIDSAVADCEARADELGTIPAAALSAACQEVGDAVKRNLDNADENVDMALADAAKSCSDLAGSIPAGSAHDALSSLCETISTER